MGMDALDPWPPVPATRSLTRVVRWPYRFPGGSAATVAREALDSMKRRQPARIHPSRKGSLLLPASTAKVDVRSAKHRRRLAAAAVISLAVLSACSASEKPAATASSGSSYSVSQSA